MSERRGKFVEQFAPACWDDLVCDGKIVTGFRRWLTHALRPLVFASKKQEPQEKKEQNKKPPQKEEEAETTKKIPSFFGAPRKRCRKEDQQQEAEKKQKQEQEPKECDAKTNIETKINTETKTSTTTTEPLKRVALLSGSPGTGKSTMVRLGAAEHGLQLRRYNMSNYRTKESIDDLRSLVFRKTSTNNQQQKNLPSCFRSMSAPVLVALEEIDGMASEGFAELCNLCEEIQFGRLHKGKRLFKSNNPLVLLGNNTTKLVGYRESPIAGMVEHFYFPPLDPRFLFQLGDRVLASQKKNLELKQLVDQAQGDARFFLNALEHRLLCVPDKTKNLDLHAEEPQQQENLNNDPVVNKSIYCSAGAYAKRVFDPKLSLQMFELSKLSVGTVTDITGLLHDNYLRGMELNDLDAAVSIASKLQNVDGMANVTSMPTSAAMPLLALTGIWCTHTKHPKREKSITIPTTKTYNYRVLAIKKAMKEKAIDLFSISPQVYPKPVDYLYTDVFPFCQRLQISEKQAFGDPATFI